MATEWMGVHRCAIRLGQSRYSLCPPPGGAEHPCNTLGYEHLAMADEDDNGHVHWGFTSIEI